MTFVRRLLSDNFGRCFRCIRTAFLTAVGLTACFLLERMLFPNVTTLATAILITALIIWSIWTTHVIVFTGRTTRAYSSEVRSKGRPLSRRDYLTDFVKILAYAALASAVPTLAAACGAGETYCGSAGCCSSDRKCCCTYPTSKYCEQKDHPCTC